MAHPIEIVLNDLLSTNQEKDIMVECVEKRLAKSLETFSDEMKQTKLYLAYKNEYSVLRKYRRLVKDEEI